MITAMNSNVLKLLLLKDGTFKLLEMVDYEKFRVLLRFENK